ncbi:MAG: metallophosphoesterase family protein [Luteibaculum sp.]
MEIALISDTHSHLDNKIWKYLEAVDEIWHGGDVGTISTLEKLEKIKPVYGVYGNIDDHQIRKVLPEFLVLERLGWKFALTHIGGKPYVYPARVSHWLDQVKPHVYICGHSHILRVERDKKRGFLYLNPGAAGNHGFHKIKTLLLFSIDPEMGIKNLRVVELGRRGELADSI